MRIAARGLGWLDQVAVGPALAAAARALLVAGPPPAAAAERTVVHGDLHACNVLVGRAAGAAGAGAAAGAITGVIDWGDCAAGDPAIDLAIGWSVVPAAARPAFLAAYGPVAPATWARARIGAVSRQGLALLASGQDLGDAALVAWATRSLARALDDGG